MLKWIDEVLDRVTPEAGLPRRYIFYRDGAFWIFSALAVAYLALMTWVISRLNTSLDIGWWTLLPLGLLLIPVVIGYWICYDSYRWYVPRSFLINLRVYWNLTSYLYVRQEWLMRVKQAAHLRELGLKE